MFPVPNRRLSPLSRLVPLAVAGLVAGSCVPRAPEPAEEIYFPGPGSAWERRTPEEVGMDPGIVAEAIATAVAGEVTTPRDLLEAHRRGFGLEPYGEAVGPFMERGPASGLVVKDGYIVAEWGEPDRVEPTFSVAKSFLSSVVGIAYDRGLIEDIHARVGDTWAPVIALEGPIGQGLAALNTPAPREVPVPRGGIGSGAAWDAFEVLTPFTSERNSKITWNHLLRQTSDWDGVLWGKPDWADRPRGNIDAWRTRERPEPGEVYTYNDVRVNLLALAALNVWRRPLPEVLKDELMDPIGASSNWRWMGYDNSWVLLDGRMVQSVSGGSHWGGGMWISARDMARFGYLTLNRGRWGDRQILSEEWVSMALTPTDVQPNYGFMNWYLRPVPEGCAEPCADRAFYHLGNGPNIVFVDPAHDLVVVTRWVQPWNAVVDRLVESITTVEEAAAAAPAGMY